METTTLQKFTVKVEVNSAITLPTNLGWITGPPFEMCIYGEDEQDAFEKAMSILNYIPYEGNIRCSI